MTTDPTTGTTVVPSAHPLLRVVLLIAAALAVGLGLSLIFGVAGPDPVLQLVPDPAGALPF